MKLIEKMGRDAWESMDTWPNSSDQAFRVAFQAGFRAAREMAAEIAAREESNTPYKILMIGESEADE